MAAATPSRIPRTTRGGIFAARRSLEPALPHQGTLTTGCRSWRVTEPVPGANLILTIDSDLQKLAEKAVSHVAASAVVVVEVKTGKVKAIVSKPSFDPNIMTGHLTRQEETMLKSDPRKPFVERFRREVDPAGVLPIAGRRRRAEPGMRAHLPRLALRSAQARRQRAPDPA